MNQLESNINKTKMSVNMKKTIIFLKGLEFGKTSYGEVGYWSGVEFSNN